MSERRFPWRTLLFLSLAVNLLVIGGIVGALGAGVRVQREQPPGAVVERIPGPRAFLAALPPETRAKMRDELASSWTQSRDLRRAALQARRDAFQAARAEPYDEARVRAAFQRLREADQAALAVFQDNIVRAFGQLSPDERREALEALRTAPPASRSALPRDTQEGAAPAAQGDGAATADGETWREKQRRRREERRERLRQGQP